MKVKNISHYWNTFLKFADKNTPHILTVAALFGLVETGIQAFQAGPKVKEIMDFRRDRLEQIEEYGMKQEAKKDEIRYVNKAVIRELLPVMTPPILTGTATAACIIASDHISAKRIATLSAAYTIADTALKEYKSKVTEVVGDKKARSIGEALAKDKVKNDPPTEDVVLAETKIGDVLCYDAYSGRYFYSNNQKILQAVNTLCHDCMLDMYVSLNDFYDLIGLRPVGMGDELGWNTDDLIRGQLPITTTAIMTDEGVPCLCVDYDAHLRRDFRDLH